MSVKPKLTCKELRLKLLSVGYQVPILVLNSHTRTERGKVEHWIIYEQRKVKLPGSVAKRPSWLGTWFVGER